MASVGLIVWELFTIFDFPVSPTTEMHILEYGQIWPISLTYINRRVKNTKDGVESPKLLHTQFDQSRVRCQNVLPIAKSHFRQTGSGTMAEP